MATPKQPTTARGIEIICPECGQETLLKRESVFEGFKRVGEKFSCAACGLVFPDEAAVPFKVRKPIPGFERRDLPPKPKVFSEQEVRETVSRLCRHCAHYVVNPFLQRCGLSKREVAATDSCAEFTAKPVPTTEGA